MQRITNLIQIDLVSSLRLVLVRDVPGSVGVPDGTLLTSYILGGIAVFPLFSRIEHGCSPALSRSMDGGQIVLHAPCEIPIFGELNYAAIDVLWPFGVRQEQVCHAELMRQKMY